jgi:hypothetical protein
MHLFLGNPSTEVPLRISTGAKPTQKPIATPSPNSANLTPDDCDHIISSLWNVQHQAMRQAETHKLQTDDFKELIRQTKDLEILLAKHGICKEPAEATYLTETSYKPSDAMVFALATMCAFGALACAFLR